MAFFCLPIFFGCPTKIKPEGDEAPRICPRCNNASTIRAKSRLWFELCFVPLVPMNSKHIWLCTVCQWNVPLQQGWEPQVPGYGFHPGGMHGSPYPPMGPQPPHPSYQPSYHHPKPN